MRICARSFRRTARFRTGGSSRCSTPSRARVSLESRSGRCPRKPRAGDRMSATEPPCAPLPRLRIVDGVFGRPDPGGRPRWAVAVATVAGFYLALFGLLPVLIPSSLAPWAAALAARVHAELGRQSELTVEPPALAPPAPPPPPTAVRTARVAIHRARAAP